MEETNRHERLSQKEHQDVEERSWPSALIVHEAIRREGVAELEWSSSALAWSGLANHLPSGEWVPLVSKLGYSTGSKNLPKETPHYGNRSKKQVWLKEPVHL